MNPARGGRIFISLLVLFAVGAVIYVLGSYRGKHRAVSMNCAGSMTSICLVGRLWAEEHDGKYPTNLMVMSNELSTPKVLSCVRERRASMWESFTPSNCTYKIINFTPSLESTNDSFLRCTVHGRIGYIDGTVFDGVRRRGKFDWK